MSHETGISMDSLDTLLDTLSKGHLVEFDDESEVVWVKKMLDRQGFGEKHNSSAASQLRSLHKCALIKDFLKFYSHRKIPYRYPIDRSPRGCHQEQDQNQEQDCNLKSDLIRSSSFEELYTELVSTSNSLTPTNGQEKQLLAKAVILSRTTFSEHWLNDAIEATVRKHPAKPFAYFRQCLIEGAAVMEKDFNEAFASVKVPATLYEFLNLSIEERKHEGNGRKRTDADIEQQNDDQPPAE